MEKEICTESAPNSPQMSAINEHKESEHETENVGSQSQNSMGTFSRWRSIQSISSTNSATSNPSVFTNSSNNKSITGQHVIPAAASPKSAALLSQAATTSCFESSGYQIHNGSPTRSIRRTDVYTSNENLMDEFKDVKMSAVDKWKMAALKVSIKEIGGKCDNASFHHETKQYETNLPGQSTGHNICIKITQPDSDTDGVEIEDFGVISNNKAIENTDRECSKSNQNERKKVPIETQLFEDIPEPTTQTRTDQRQLEYFVPNIDEIHREVKEPKENLISSDNYKHHGPRYSKQSSEINYQEGVSIHRLYHPTKHSEKAEDTVGQIMSDNSASLAYSIKEGDRGIITNNHLEQEARDLRDNRATLNCYTENQQCVQEQGTNEAPSKKWAVLRQKYLEYLNRVRPSDKVKTAYRNSRASSPTFKSSQHSSPGSCSDSFSTTSMETCSVCFKSLKASGEDGCICFVDSGNESYQQNDETDVEDLTKYSFNVDDVTVACDVTGNSLSSAIGKLNNYGAFKENGRFGKSECTTQDNLLMSWSSDLDRTPDPCSFISFRKERKKSGCKDIGDNIFEYDEDLVDGKGWKTLRKAQSLSDDFCPRTLEYSDSDFLSGKKSYSFDLLSHEPVVQDEVVNINLTPDNQQNDESSTRINKSSGTCLEPDGTMPVKNIDVEHTVSIVNKDDMVKSIFYIRKRKGDNTFRSCSLPEETTHISNDVDDNTYEYVFGGQGYGKAALDKRRDRFALVKKAWNSFDEDILSVLKPVETNTPISQSSQDNNFKEKKRAEISLKINYKADVKHNDDGVDKDEIDKENEEILEVVIENDVDYSVGMSKPIALSTPKKHLGGIGVEARVNNQNRLDSFRTLSDPRYPTVLSPLSVEMNKSDNSDWSDEESLKLLSRQQSYVRTDWSPLLVDFSAPTAAKFHSTKQNMGCPALFTYPIPQTLPPMPVYNTPMHQDISRKSSWVEDSDVMAEDISVSDSLSCGSRSRTSSFIGDSKSNAISPVSTHLNVNKSRRVSPIHSFCETGALIKPSLAHKNVKEDQMNTNAAAKFPPISNDNGDVTISNLHENLRGEKNNIKEKEPRAPLKLQQNKVGLIPFKEKTVTPTKFRCKDTTSHRTGLENSTQVQGDIFGCNWGFICSYEKDFCWDSQAPHSKEKILTPTKYRKRKYPTQLSTDTHVTSTALNGRKTHPTAHHTSSNKTPFKSAETSVDSCFKTSWHADKTETEDSNISGNDLNSGRLPFDYNTFLSWMLRNHDVQWTPHKNPCTCYCQNCSCRDSWRCFHAQHKVARIALDKCPMSGSDDPRMCGSEDKNACYLVNNNNFRTDGTSFTGEEYKVLKRRRPLCL